jgi:hypothetical protein
VIWPCNTEWEIFTVKGKPHMLGALFALGHREAFDLGVPPVGPVAAEARRQGALLDLDKHNWPWSMAIVPAAQVDLYELANNHIWRTAFAFTNWATPAPEWMKGGATGERAWINFTLENYYALLNCGFRLRPTAGTASGVHPVPLGFSRVYVHCPEGFSYAHWFQGLNSGHSFVTTGPMLLVTFNGQDPGSRFHVVSTKPFTVTVSGHMLSANPGQGVELIRDGRVLKRIPPQNHPTSSGALETRFQEEIPFHASGWLAVRCWEERPGGRQRYAHTAPIFVDRSDHPFVPERRAAEFLAQSVQNELARSETLLSAEAVVEYRRALATYEDIARRAR